MKHTDLKQKLTVPLITVLLPGLLCAQGGIGHLRVTNGANLIMTGTVNLVLNDINFTNDGNFSAGNSKVFLTGIKTAGIGGSHFCAFNNLIVQKNSNSVQLQQNISVGGAITMNGGNLLLNNFDLDLGSTGSIINERNNCNIMGATGGTVSLTRVLQNPSTVNPGNIGVEITSLANMGAVTIIRSHVPQILQDGTQSIQRSFNISSSNFFNAGFNATLRFFYLDNELNGAVESDLQLWAFFSESSFAGGNSFAPIGKDASDIAANWVLLSGIDQMGIFSLAGPGSGIVGREEPRTVKNLQGAAEAAVAGKLSMHIFPNPSRVMFNVELTSNVERDIAVSLIDQNGHLLQQKKIHCRAGKNLILWDMSPYAAGAYFITAENTGLKNIKIIKQ